MSQSHKLFCIGWALKRCSTLSDTDRTRLSLNTHEHNPGKALFSSW